MKKRIRFDTNEGIEEGIINLRKIEKKYGSLTNFWQVQDDLRKNTQKLMKKQEPIIKRVIEKRKAEFMKI